MKQIAPEVYHIPLLPRNSINCYLIEGVLIDAGIRSSRKKIAACLEKIPVHAHALTHAHPDHQGASASICTQFNIPLYCHEKEVQRTQTGLVTNEYPSTQHRIARFQQKYWAGEGHQVAHTLKENDLIGNFRVIETPGHASGHISFFREKDGILILGDAAVNMHLLTTIVGLRLPPSLFTADQKENICSLKKVAQLNPQIICFGHGPVLHNKNKSFEKFVEKL